MGPGFLASLVSCTLTVWLPMNYRTMFNLLVQDALTFGVANKVAGLFGGLRAAFASHIWVCGPWFVIGFLGAA